MREIKFRGMVVDSITVNGKKNVFVYGDRIHYDKEDYYILSQNERNWDVHEGCRVIPETVGQFTGLLDKNGKEIYEGDIINIKGGFIRAIYWDDERLGWSTLAECDADTDGEDKLFYHGWDGINELEVIGNIHENKELLK